MIRLFLFVCVIIAFQEQAASQSRLFNFVDDVLAYQNQIEVFVNDSTGKRQLDGFDGNEYMNLFPLIRIEHLKCTYENSPLGGHPRLSIDGKPASRCVVPLEDTPESYCQFLYFCEFGDLFALFGHALYREKCIVRSSEELENILNDTLIILKSPDEKYKFDEKRLEKAFELGISPLVEMKDDSCIITIYEKRYEEIRRVSYTIQRKSPYGIVAIEEETPLIEIIHNNIF